jgi:hypothetical protein
MTATNGPPRPGLSERPTPSPPSAHANGNAAAPKAPAPQEPTLLYPALHLLPLGDTFNHIKSIALAPLGTRVKVRGKQALGEASDCSFA